MNKKLESKFSYSSNEFEVGSVGKVFLISNTNTNSFHLDNQSFPIMPDPNLGNDEIQNYFNTSIFISGYARSTYFNFDLNENEEFMGSGAYYARPGGTIFIDSPSSFRHSFKGLDLVKVNECLKSRGYNIELPNTDLIEQLNLF